jgi:hypothetical protein
MCRVTCKASMACITFGWDCSDSHFLSGVVVPKKAVILGSGFDFWWQG